MNGIILTQQGGFLGPIAKVLGVIMDAIFNFTDLIGVPSIGLSIILFTIVIYFLLLPLTIKQQKFSKLSAKMNPAEPSSITSYASFSLVTPNF